MPRRVAITGLGIVSSMGNRFSDVCKRLYRGESGIRKMNEWEAFNMRSCVGGAVDDPQQLLKQSGLPRKKLRYASASGIYCAVAANDAIQDAAVDLSAYDHTKIGCIVGNGTSGLLTIYHAGELLYADRANRIDPYSVCKTMANSCSAVITNLFALRGRSYSISSACTTSMHNIGHAYELIRDGQLDMAIAGGGEEFHELIAAAFNAMRLALSSNFNDSPEKASRPYDVDRDGFVLSGGAGIVILEPLDAARQRGARIYAEIVGFAANSDGYDYILPEPEGQQGAACMNSAIESAHIAKGDIDYINTHGTATLDGDVAEVNAMRQVFGDHIPAFSSTKSMSGHSIGAAGAQELIYCIGMLEDQFIAPSINIDRRDAAFEGLPIVTETRSAPLHIVMSNGFGFGGTNAVVILKKADD